MHRAVEYGVCPQVHDVLTQRHQWYRFTCGASIPATLLQLDLERATHFARGDGAPATRHMRLNLSVYRQLLGMTDKFLLFVHATTMEVLSQEAHTNFHTVSHHPTIEPLTPSITSSLNAIMECQWSPHHHHTLRLLRQSLSVSVPQ